jgi:hypothetical protein
VPERERLVLVNKDEAVSESTLTSIEALNATFHARKFSGSMIVDCVISCPGKTPHVTASRTSSSTLLLLSP